MKTSFQLIIFCLAVLLTACSKPVTVRHVMMEETVPLGQHVDDFYKDFCSFTQSTFEELGGSWHLDKDGDIFFLMFVEDGDSIPLFHYVGGLYNDTVYCFSLQHDYPYDESGIEIAKLRETCDSILWENDEALLVRFYLPGGYLNYDIDLDGLGWNATYYDSIGLARYDQLHLEN